ncbi:MAG: electron transfer flavoprotein subunit alpha/FixB family protein [Bacteroidales bacterium]|nr:electron transfer flavoprotein subunit alpha/FixB family protein [Bacteroidales bacterium]HPD94585.1 electron transfer flavoprotein subunit alpha/FixB family protein [Tenuifilaceae bacterium]
MSVLVYTENWDGKFKKVSFELISYASKVAEMLNTDVAALSIGNVANDELQKLGGYGASKILSVENDNAKVFDAQNYTGIIAQVAEKIGAKVIIIANNNTGKAVAPRLSVKLKAALGASVSKLPLSVSPFTIYKRSFSGSAFSDVELKTDIKIITLAQNSFELIETANNATIEKVDINVDAPKTEVIDVQKQTGKLLLTDAEIVVSGGRGMKSPDNWGPLVELAEVLGGATACSRPVSDEGWRSHEEHTGQTGKIIAPNLYIAVGISGATQHIAGVSGSKYIVAINNDKSAPIFEVAQYGIVGDAQKILPQLVEAAKQVKGK